MPVGIVRTEQWEVPFPPSASPFLILTGYQEQQCLPSSNSIQCDVCYNTKVKMQLAIKGSVRLFPCARNSLICSWGCLMDLGVVSLKTSVLMLRNADPAWVSCKQVSTRATVENAKQLCTRIQCGEDWIPLSLCSGKILTECLTKPFMSSRHCHMFSWNTGPEHCASWCLTQNTDWWMLTSLLGPSGCLCRSDDGAKLFGLFPLEGIFLNLLPVGISVMTPLKCIHTYMHMAHFSTSYRMNQIILFLWFGWEAR